MNVVTESIYDDLTINNTSGASLVSGCWRWQPQVQLHWVVLFHNLLLTLCDSTCYLKSIMNLFKFLRYHLISSSHRLPWLYNNVMIWIFIPSFGKMTSCIISKDIWAMNTKIFWLYSQLFIQVCLSLFLFLKLMPDMKEDNLILMTWIETNNYSSFCGNRLQGISSAQNLSLSLTGSLLAVSVDSKCDNRAPRVDCLHQWSYYCLNWGQWDISHKDCAWVMAITLQPSSTCFFFGRIDVCGRKVNVWFRRL